MTKGILCSIDFSETSKNALNWSISLTETLNSHLTILYAYRLNTSLNGDAAEYKKKIEDEATRKFTEIEKELLAGKNIEYDFKVEVGFVSNRVKDFMKKQDLGFLVIGTPTNNGNRETFDELVKEARVPLVIVPKS